MCKKPVALIIMDGFGYNADDYGNAIAAAKKPNIDRYMQGPHTYIGASGLDAVSYTHLRESRAMGIKKIKFIP